MTTSNVVTMEYVPGIKINDIQRIEEAGIDRCLLAQRSAEAYLTQLCRHGFFRKCPSISLSTSISFSYHVCFDSMRRRFTRIVLELVTRFQTLIELVAFN